MAATFSGAHPGLYELPPQQPRGAAGPTAETTAHFLNSFWKGYCLNYLYHNKIEPLPSPTCMYMYCIYLLSAVSGTVYRVQLLYNEVLILCKYRIFHMKKHCTCIHYLLEIMIKYMYMYSVQSNEIVPFEYSSIFPAYMCTFTFTCRSILWFVLHYIMSAPLMKIHWSAEPSIHTELLSEQDRIFTMYLWQTTFFFACKKQFTEEKKI